MQDLMVVGFIVDEILRDIKEKPYARFDGCRLYS